MISNTNKSREPIKSDSPREERRIISFVNFMGRKEPIYDDDDYYDFRERMK